MKTMALLVGCAALVLAPAAAAQARPAPAQRAELERPAVLVRHARTLENQAAIGTVKLETMRPELQAVGVGLAALEREAAGMEGPAVARQPEQLRLDAALRAARVHYGVLSREMAKPKPDPALLKTESMQVRRAVEEAVAHERRLAKARTQAARTRRS